MFQLQTVRESHGQFVTLEKEKFICVDLLEFPSVYDLELLIIFYHLQQPGYRQPCVRWLYKSGIVWRFKRID